MAEKTGPGWDWPEQRTETIVAGPAHIKRTLWWMHGLSDPTREGVLAKFRAQLHEDSKTIAENRSTQASIEAEVAQARKDAGLPPVGSLSPTVLAIGGGAAVLVLLLLLRR